MSLVGLDIGTTGCKATVFGSMGDILGQSSREYPIQTPSAGWAEQDAELVWQLAWSSLSDAVTSMHARFPTAPDPEALALSVQGEAVVPVDGKGQPMRPVILGMDTRSVEQNEWLKVQIGADALFNRTGMPVHTINTLPKLLWLRRHEPGIWRDAHQFLLYEDFFLRRLGGKAVISHCLASRTQMYDLTSQDWAHDILAECGIEVERLAPLAPEDGGVVGSLQEGHLHELGLQLSNALGEWRA